VTSAVGDVFNDLVLLDTRGRTIFGKSSTASNHLWVDEPDPTTGVGLVWAGNDVDRSDAASVMDGLQAHDVLLAYPGTARMLILCPSAPLEGEATYYARWRQEATS
jgi:hypothetical protein